MQGKPASGWKTAGVALGSYVAPLTSARAVRIGFFIALGFLALVGVALLLRPVSEAFSAFSLERLRQGAIVPGVPLAALLLSEIPVRDGIRHRTLLYPLLGPVPRHVLIAVRTAATALLTGLGLGALILFVQIVEGGDAGILGRELLAVLLGSAAYVALFGWIHLLTRRGLIAGLAVYALVDDPLSRLPFSLRNLSPSFHLRVLADQLVAFELPVDFSPPPVSETASALTLLAMSVVLIAIAMAVFARKQLGEIC